MFGFFKKKKKAEETKEVAPAAPAAAPVAAACEYKLTVGSDETPDPTPAQIEDAVRAIEGNDGDFLILDSLKTVDDFEFMQAMWEGENSAFQVEARRNEGSRYVIYGAKYDADILINLLWEFVEGKVPDITGWEPVTDGDI